MRLIDADEITAFLQLERNDKEVESLDEFPTIEIIHCQDCEKYGTKFCAMDIWTDQLAIRRAKPDDFCSRAERWTE